MHAVKVERHDTARSEHHTNTGVRPVHVYREHHHGLFVARPFLGHPKIAYWQAHLLPELGIQLCRYELHGGRREFDYYMDVAVIRRDGETWSVRDLYLDLTVWNGKRAQVLDTSELCAARLEGLVDEREALWAVERAHTILNELGQHDYHVDTWLDAQGIRLEWHEPVLV
ncbi:DUF402 domain-containing protein [Deinococcus yavapaiensis]|uniref:DUF402 domain-containing protein n=1 Tax=Deinococcus yavapaiensis KR-236 TaxID=694435 RepID=A0A318SBS4_9DEIO|nr:DUF402 domain-containing protein [Deinococcus yavapaiensis]PYE56498.1 hypothetical protein DES52_101302 [Deinococcus yavapaiensis KR-236]